MSPLIVWAAGFLIISLVGLFVSCKTLKIDLDKNGELVVAMLTILGTLVSVLLGLMVSSVTDHYSALESCTNSEATSVGEVFRLSRGLPAAAAIRLQDRCIEYCEAAISDEWPAMKEGQQSDKVSTIFTSLSDEIVNFRPANDGEASIQGALLSATSEIGQNRGTRIVVCRSAWSRRLLPLILTCAIVVLVCSYLYAGKGNALLHSVLVGLVAITLGINIGVIFLMGRPFSSEWSIQPTAFELHVKRMKAHRGEVLSH